MRTSNKLLLGILIVPLLILTLLHVALYAKYKSGSYISMKSIEEDRFTKKTFKNIHNIAVYGLHNLTIRPADSLRLEIEKDANGHLHYTIVGDSLVIHGDSTVRRANGSSDTERSYNDVNLYAPMMANIMADNSAVRLEGSKDSLKAIAYHFSLAKSASLKVDQYGDDTTHVYFKDLTVKASGSAGIELTAHTRVRELVLNLFESAFTDNGAAIEQLTIEADSLSNISLKGANMKKLYSTDNRRTLH